MATDIELHASGAETATGNGSGSAPGQTHVAVNVTWELDVTVAADDVDDTFNVFVQTKIGDDWLDVVHFTEVLGNATPKKFYEKQVAALTEAGFEAGAALAGGAVRNLIGSEWRVRWVIVDPTGANASFTFSVKGARDN